MTKHEASLSLRRLRQNPLVRELTRAVRVSPEQFIQPHFVVDGITEPQPVKGLPGICRETPDSLLRQIETDISNGTNKAILFGVPAAKAEKDFDFSFTAQQIAAIKQQFGSDIWLAVDVCLCSATTHGHCGVMNDGGNHIINAGTVAELARASLIFAQAGADCVAPSDMMDGRVGVIRSTLDENGFDATVLMSYAAKFRSGFYGPFRDAADSAPQANTSLTNRATYQIDPGRPADALASALRDASEGADILMVKPGLPCLDVLAELSQTIPEKPWAVYQVSGEYAAIELLAEHGLADGPAAHVEAWQAFVRAGASIIVSYGARSAAAWLNHCRDRA
jgi:porphobilinogen synthase